MAINIQTIFVYILYAIIRLLSWWKIYSLKITDFLYILHTTVREKNYMFLYVFFSLVFEKLSWAQFITSNLLIICIHLFHSIHINKSFINYMIYQCFFFVILNKLLRNMNHFNGSNPIVLYIYIERIFQSYNFRGFHPDRASNFKDIQIRLVQLEPPLIYSRFNKVLY